MNKEYIYNIYTNLFKYLEYRKKRIPAVLNKKEFLETFNSDNLVILNSDDVIIILTKPTSKFATFLSDSKKKIKDLCSNNDTVKELLYICDVNYIGLKTNTSLNLVRKTISDLKSLYKDVWLQVRPYQSFELDIPNCVIVPKHTIISNAEAEKMMKVEYKNKNNIPQIMEYDPPITWLGARAGDYVEIDRYSPSVGVQKIIRHVII